METIEMMGACGYDCGACAIRRIPLDPEGAESALSWFRDMGWLAEGEGAAEAIAKNMYCCGCFGDRAHHWSADCAMLLCCVERGLAHCAQCDEFPCAHVTAFEQDEYPPHQEAVARLRRIAAARGREQ